MGPGRAARIGIGRNPIWKPIGGVAGAIIAFALLIWLGRLGVYSLSYAEFIVPSLIRGFAGTLWLVAAVIPIGFTMGLFMAWARTSDSRVARAVGGTYVEF